VEEFVDSGRRCCGPVREVDNTMDRVAVGNDGADGRRACNVLPVLLMANGILPLRTPTCSAVVEGVGLQMECCCKIVGNVGCT